MRYLRLFSVSFLLAFTITGCHRKQEQVLPPPQAQAPIVSTLPPMPPLTFPDVQLAKPESATPVVQAAPPESVPPPAKHVRHHRARHKTDTGTAATESTPNPAPAAASGATALGQLSADDAAVSPDQTAQTEHLIQSLESRLKKMPKSQQAKHKEDIAQANSFLAQAKQAWTMNDRVGAQTLANKAKILLDELSK